MRRYPLINGPAPAPCDWGGWRLDPKWFVLVHSDDPQYEIDLEGCTSSADTLDWIMQITGKGWATDAVVAGLVRALDDLLQPQAHLCSFGQSKRMTRAAIRREITTAARHVPSSLLVEEST